MFTARFAAFSFVLTLVVAVPIMARAENDLPLAPAAENDQPSTTPAENDATKTEPAETTALAAAQSENAGQADLDQAAQLKVAADGLADLNTVVDKLDSAIEKGLDNDNQAFAKQLLTSTLLQRATLLSTVLLDKPLQDPRRDPRWMQVREYALTDLQRAIGMDDKLWDAHLLVGKLQSLPLGDPNAAKRSLSKVIDAPDASAIDRAESLALRGSLQTDDKKREDDFNRAIELQSDKPDFYRVRAQYYYGADKFDLALTDIDQALKLEPDHAASQELRGLILLGLNRLDDALATFNKAGELAPQAVLPYQHRGEVYRRQGDLQKAVEQLTKALEMMPGDVGTLVLRANVYTQLGDNDHAVEDIDEVIRRQPQLLMAHLLKAEIYASTKRIDQAIEQLERLVPLAPNEPRLLEPLATYCLVGDQPHKAIDGFSKVLELDPDNYRALRFRGDAYLRIGKHAEAVADFERAVKLKDDDDGLLNNFAWVLATSPKEEVRDGKRAIDLATKAAELTTYNVPHILSTLAAAYAETGDFETAKKWSQKAVELGEDEEIKKQLATELKSYEEGKPVRELQEDQDKSPANPSPGDHTFAPPSAAPAPARTLDF